MKWTDLIGAVSRIGGLAFLGRRFRDDAAESWAEFVPNEPLYSIMDEAAARFHDRPCVDFLGKIYSYGEIGDLVNRAASGFQQMGVGKGVKVGLFLPNTPYFVICY